MGQQKGPGTKKPGRSTRSLAHSTVEFSGEVIPSTALMRRTEKSWLIKSRRKPHSGLKFRCMLFWILLTDCVHGANLVLAHGVVSLRQPRRPFATPLGKKQQGVRLQLDRSRAPFRKPPIFSISALCNWSLFLQMKKTRENSITVLPRESNAG